MPDREQWSYQSETNWNNDEWSEGEITVTVRADGKVLVEVEEEQAVDSCNQMFKCACLLPREKVAELSALLTRALVIPRQPEGTGA
jgi:hypothetical protein